ncbi:arabinan endo-1,5-alpha-L-arabinosidase [Mucilaginibacter sp. CSA2-8R]|uniref:arabinan endo-1,5-alpha-L-arabinosidase n=1 Tax=Mucilaginibacter sp. CSA2-8R TaxID=3141542 RepID=UPI00315CA1AE
MMSYLKSYHYLLICSLFWLIGVRASAQEKTSILKGDLRVHDPVMIKQGDTYYIFSTGKGIPIKTSKDKITWKNSGTVFTNPLPWFKTDIPEQDGSLWAPDIHYRDGKFHLYYSVSAWMNFNSSIGYATNTTLNTDDPAYKWIDEGQVIGFKNGGKGVNVIDPNVVVEKNGKVWLLYGSYKAGLRLVELDKKTGKLKSDNPELITITPSLGEGSYIIKGPEYYYIFASRGICCKGIQSTYQVVMGRAKNIKGPYLNKQGESWLNDKYTVFLEGNYEEPGRGHNGFFTERDTTFIVYHAYTRSANGASLLNIKPVYVDADGWPAVAEIPKLFKLDDQKNMQVVGSK